MIAAGTLRWRVAVERPIIGDHGGPGGLLRWEPVRMAFVRPSGSGSAANPDRIAWAFYVRSGPMDVGWRLKRGDRCFLVKHVTRDASPGFDEVDAEEML